MKKLALILFCTFGISLTASAYVKRVVTISRSNGLFGYYSDIDQVFLGYYPDGTEAWTLDCHNPGFVKCKLRPSAGKTARQTEIEDIENTKLSDLMLDIETNEVDNGNTSGSTVKHYQATLSDNSTVDIYITLTWAPDTAHSGSTLFNAEMSY